MSVVVVVEHDYVVGPAGDVLENLAAQLLRQVFVGDVVVALEKLDEVPLDESVTAGEDQHVELPGGCGFFLGVGRDGDRRQSKRPQQRQKSRT